MGPNGSDVTGYSPQKPPIAETSDQLRARIPGWGADLDPADRPAVPKLQFQDDLSGAHWEFPERQPEKWPRLFEHVRDGYLKPSELVTHRFPLEHIAEGYHVFSAKLDGCIKPLVTTAA